MIEQGHSAPDFELPDQDGRPVRRSDFRGQPVVLYFYPKAGTSGCTRQACGVRDHASAYELADAVVLGVSPDPVELVKDFHEAQGLNFALLADKDHAVCEAYGVWGEKTHDGGTYEGASRTTFIIDSEGRVARVLERVSPDTHDEQVLEALEQLPTTTP